MVVTQLVKRLLPTPEVRSLNPVIGTFLFRTFVYRFNASTTLGIGSTNVEAMLPRLNAQVHGNGPKKGLIAKQKFRFSVFGA